MAEFSPTWVSRQETLHWKKEIMKLLFLFCCFWGCFFFSISLSAIAQKSVVMEYVWWRWIAEEKCRVQISLQVYELSCAFDRLIFHNGSFVFFIIGKHFSIASWLESDELTNMQRDAISKDTGKIIFFLKLWRKVGKGMVLTDLWVRQPN